MEIIRNKRKPRGITGVIAAVEGFGKTTTIGSLPGLYMLDVDDGSYGIDCPLIKFNGTVAGMLALIQEIKSGKAPSDMQNLGIDTADMLVQMLTNDLCKRRNWNSMEEKDYGKCWGEFKPEWAKVVNGLKDVARTKGINVIYTLHISGDKTYTQKTTGKQWNRWMARMTPKTSEELYASTDFYFSGIYDVDTMEQKAGRTKLNLAVNEERMIYTEHSSDHDGKCRSFIVMPDGSRMKKSMSLNEFQKIFAGMIEASTDRDGKPGDFVEPKNEEKPSAEEPPKPAEEPQEPAQTSTVTERECITELRKSLGQYDLTDAQISEYAASKLRDRYGMTGNEPFAEWPEELVLWMVRMMDKISAKIKQS